MGGEAQRPKSSTRIHPTSTRRRGDSPQIRRRQTSPVDTVTPQRVLFQPERGPVPTPTRLAPAGHRRRAGRTRVRGRKARSPTTPPPPPHPRPPPIAACFCHQAITTGLRFLRSPAPFGAWRLADAFRVRSTAAASASPDIRAGPDRTRFGADAGGDEELPGRCREAPGSAALRDSVLMRVCRRDLEGDGAISSLPTGIVGIPPGPLREADPIVPALLNKSLGPKQPTEKMNRVALFRLHINPIKRVMTSRWRLPS